MSAVICAAWGPLLLRGLVPLDGNMIALSYPNWSMTRDLGAGSLLPAWNPWRDMGEPFFADPQTMAAYPVMRALCLLPDFSAFLRSWVVLHTLLAACFLGVLAWRLYASPAACAAAAALAGLNGAFTGRVTFPNHFAAASWLPAILYFQQELSPLGLGVSVAMQWFAGFPPFSVLSVLAVSVWAAGQGRKGLKCLIQGGLWAMGLAAVQWIPFLEFMARASRTLVLDSATARQYSLAPGQLLKEAFIPQWIHFSPSVIGDPAIVCFYTGLAAWGLAGWAVWRGGRRETALVSCCAAAFLLSLGGHLPGFDAMTVLRIFRFPANWLLLAAATLALLAASGVARLRGAAWQWGAVAVVILDLVVFAQAPRAAWALPSFLSEPPAVTRSFQGERTLSRIYHTEELRRAWERGFLETEDDYLLMRDFIAPSYGAAFRVSEASSYQTLRLKTANAYLDRLAKEGPRSSMADWAGIEMVAGLKRGARRVARDTVGLTPRGPARPRVFLEPRDAGTSKIGSYRPGRVTARIDAVGEGRVVLSEMDYPGWRVFVDGRPAPKVLFAQAFPSVVVPAGGHDVLFVFRSWSLIMGAGISLLSVLALVLAVSGRRTAPIRGGAS
ncbi:MAG: hypothetical protein HYV14_10975 [Elusimicrobia bacterium]|nr:hypothetical protein [Elusimicrobiota bacterium]